MPTNINIEKKQIEVVFIGNRGYLSFGDYSYPQNINSYSFLYINNDFSEISIIVNEMVGNRKNNASYRRGPEDGLLISGPATNRKEALRISNKLIEDLLKPLE
ncbi:MAG: hypothetical protein LPK00_09065 [Bacillaceae bacterium]|nr:hypothetical protein [Bacillaceae bacterium]